MSDRDPSSSSRRFRSPGSAALALSLALLAGCSSTPICAPDAGSCTCMPDDVRTCSVGKLAGLALCNSDGTWALCAPFLDGGAGARD